MARALSVVQTFDDLCAGESIPEEPWAALGMRGVSSWHLVGPADDWHLVQRRIVAAAPSLAGLRLLAMEVEAPAKAPVLDEVAAACAQRGVAVRYDVVLVEDGRGSPAAGRTTEAILALRSRLAEDAEKRLRPGLLVIIPFRPDTIRGVFTAWQWAESQGLPYQITVGGLATASERDRYLVAEMLENAAHRSSLSLAGRYYCDSLRRALSAGEEGTMSPCVVARGDADHVTKALDKGEVALQLANPPGMWRILLAMRRMKVDKWYLLLAGALHLGMSLVDGSRRRLPRPRTRKPIHALVVGWYGTETAGDKAILGGILRPMFEGKGDLRVTVVSTLPFYTLETLRELGYEDSANVIPFDQRLIRSLLPGIHEVIVGGGPLMDLVEMYELLPVMRRARLLGVGTVIAGCGIGPARWPITRWATRALVELADRVVLRDPDSREKLRMWRADSPFIEVGFDPAISYVAGLHLPARMSRNGPPVLGVAVRDWPRKFARGSATQVGRAKLTRLWATVCDEFVDRFQGEVKLIPMHTLHVGDDDRWFQGDVFRLAAHKSRIHQLTSSYSPGEIAEQIGQCDALLGMRYHSLLFAVALGVPTVAIDYTLGGKVAAFARRVLPSDSIFDISMAEPGDILEAIARALAAPESGRMAPGLTRDSLIAGSRLAGEICAQLLEGPREDGFARSPLP